MAPSEKAMEAALKTEVKNAYDDLATRDLLTVRFIRDKVEEKLGLEEGFFLSKEWKGRSKELVKRFTNELLEQDVGGGEEDKGQGNMEIDVKPKEAKKKPVSKSTPSTKPKAKAETPVKKGVKRESGATKGRPVKRQKKEETPSGNEDISDLASAESEASESDFGDTEDSDTPKKKAKAKAKGKVRNPVKRQRKSHTKAESEDEDEDEEDSDAPKPRKKVATKSKVESKAPPVERQAKSKAKAEDSGDESSLSDLPTTKDENSDESPKKRPIAVKKRKSKVESKDEEDAKMAKDSDSDAAPSSAKLPTPKKEVHKNAFKKLPASDDEKVDVKTADAKADASESEMSVLIDEDEEQKPKKKRRSKSSPNPTKSKPTSTKVSKPAKAPAASKDKDLNPDEVTIKTLQSQLKKCGISKIWAFELKKYGDDTKARIRHLQDALRDVGMMGRFSEARAREVKEMRELQADLEAVKEGEKSWGLESGRARRSTAGGKKGGRKVLKEDSGSGDDEVSDEGKKLTRSRDESEEPVMARRAHARADLAFLGSESDD